MVITKDWDGEDKSEPFTAVGLLSEAIFLEITRPSTHSGLLEEQINLISDNPEDYRWS